MTVTRQSQFSLQMSPVEVRSATRVMLRAESKYGSIQETADGFAFLRTKGQEILLDMTVEPCPRGTRVVLTATSPPHVFGDVFGGYHLILGELKGDIMSAAESGTRDETPFTGVRSPTDDRTLMQVTFGLPPLAKAPADPSHYKAARAVLVVVVVVGVVLLPWFVSHLVALLVWLGVFAVALGVERGSAKRPAPNAEKSTGIT